jgi:hypothetical protein
MLTLGYLDFIGIVCCAWPVPGATETGADPVGGHAALAEAATC